MRFPSATRTCVEVTTSTNVPLAGISDVAPAGSAKSTAAPRVARNAIAVRAKGPISLPPPLGCHRTDTAARADTWAEPSSGLHSRLDNVSRYAVLPRCQGQACTGAPGPARLERRRSGWNRRPAAGSPLPGINEVKETL